MTPPNFFFFQQEPDVNFYYEIDEKNNYYLTNVKGQRQNGDDVDIDLITNSYTGKKIPMRVDPDPIGKKLKSYGFVNIPPPSDIVERFKYVVEAIVKIATQDGKWGFAFQGASVWQKNNFSSYNNIVKFLDVADASGFFDHETKERAQYTSKDPKDKKKKKQQTELQEFMKLDTVVKWRGRKWDETANKGEGGFVPSGDPKFKDPQEHKAKTLWRALILLDMTPDQFLAGTVTGDVLENPQKIESLTERLTEKTFQAVGIEKQIFPDKISLFQYATMYNVPTEADIPDVEGKLDKNKNVIMHRVKFGQQRDARFDPSNNGVLKQLTLVMRHFAESNGVTGAWTTLWSQKTPKAKKGDLDIDIHYLRDFEECLKNADVPFDADGNWTTYEQELRKQYNDRTTKSKRKITFPNKDTTPEKYRGKTLEYKKGDFIPFIQVSGNVVDPAKKVTIAGKEEIQKTPYYKIKKIVTNKKDWEYAYFYYKGAMELGWRAEEAFTSGANRSTADDETGVAETTSMEMQKQADGTEKLVEVKTLTLRIMTRKTAHVGEGHHGGTIVDPETQQMIRDKMALVEKYMEKKKGGGFVHTEKEAKAHGIIQEYLSRRVDENLLPNTPEDYNTMVDNKIHALIGEDGYFTEVGTMDLPSDAKFETPKRNLWKEKKWQIPQVVKVDSNRDKVKAIMRHCFEKVLPKGMFDNYFKFHTLHSLRHLFAQYFLKATEYNTGTKDFALVMELGHWGGIDVLMNFYGKSTDASIARKKRQSKLEWDAMIDGQRKVKEQQERDVQLEKDLHTVNPDDLSSEDGAQVEGGTGAEPQ